MYQEILKFWFDDIDQAKWWASDPELDQLIIKRFSAVHSMAMQCELFAWRDNASGRLAEIIILDQFSRNIFRNSALAFANDALALALSQEAIAIGADQLLSPIERSFLYLPFMHSESGKIHDVAMALYNNNGIQASIDFEIKHKQIIDRFGRYPHRNNILGRESTVEEISFLTQPGSSF